MKIDFIKMHGLSNDFIIVDCRKTGEMPPKHIMAAMTDRKTGIGCDQLIPLLPPQDPAADVYMKIINAPDASEAQACGNATRCVADLIMNQNGNEKIIIQTVAGLLHCNRAKNGLITVDMGVPRVKWDQIPLAFECDTLNLPLKDLHPLLKTPPVAVNIGNPHCVSFVDDVDSLPLGVVGPIIENNALYPEKTNAQFAKVLDCSHIRMRVWERDTGETASSGSSSCATMVAAVRRGYVDRKCDIILDGGIMSFDWRESDDHLFMTGPVAYVYEGTISIE